MQETRCRELAPGQTLTNVEVAVAAASYLAYSLRTPDIYWHIVYFYNNYNRSYDLISFNLL